MRDTIRGYLYNYQTYRRFLGDPADGYAVLEGGRYLSKGEMAQLGSQLKIILDDQTTHSV